MTIVAVTEFRTHALEAVRRVNRLGEEFVITANGKPTAVLVPYSEWESIVETLDIKKDKRLMSQIRSSLHHLKKGGRAIPFEKIDWGDA